LTDYLKEFDSPKSSKGGYVMGGKVSMEITFNDVSPDILKILMGHNPYPITVVAGLGPGTETGLRDNIDRAKDLGKVVPGLQEWVKYPCDCTSPVAGSVWETIIHLNDSHNAGRVAACGRGLAWTREEIADWMDTLDIDLRVQNDKKED
jgi:hypothetical protein